MWKHRDSAEWIDMPAAGSWQNAVAPYTRWHGSGSKGLSFPWHGIACSKNVGVFIFGCRHVVCKSKINIFATSAMFASLGERERVSHTIISKGERTRCDQINNILMNYSNMHDSSALRRVSRHCHGMHSPMLCVCVCTEECIQMKI